MDLTTLTTNLLAAKGLEEARKVVSQAITTSPDFAKRYGWTKEIFERTTEQVVEDMLVSEPPARIYKINPLSENLMAAGQLIEAAIQKQDQIYAMEVSAIETVIEDSVFEITYDEELRLAQTGLNANLALAANAPDNASANDVDRVFSMKRAMRNFRLASRSVKGSPLNLAERIVFLREQQAEIVRSIYERLMSVILVLPSSALGQPKPVPKWQADFGLDNLRQLARWVKNSIKSVERSLTEERTLNIVFSTHTRGLKMYDASGSSLEEFKLSDMLKAGGYDDFKFEFDRTLVASMTGFSNYRYLRVLSAGVAVVFDDYSRQVNEMMSNTASIAEENTKRELALKWREQLRFSLKIALPPQQGKMADTSLSERWQPARIEMDSMVPVATRCDMAAMANLPTDKVLNANPFGQWVVSVSDYAHRVNKPDSRLSDLRTIAPQSQLFDIQGLIFSLNVAMGR